MANYMRIDPCDINNGDGFRVVLWMAGCTHNCYNCHNPQTHDHNAGQKFTIDNLTEIFNYLSEEHIEGLTISGGDAFFPLNRDLIKIICKSVKVKFPNKTIWCYTGFNFEELPAELIEDVDTIIDGMYMEHRKTKKLWRGSHNQRRFDKINGQWELVD